MVDEGSKEAEGRGVRGMVQGTKEEEGMGMDE